LFADAEDLVRHRDRPVDRDGAVHPIVAGAVLGNDAQVEGERWSRGLGPGEEPLRGWGHAQALVGSLGVVVADPGVEVFLGDEQGREDLPGQELLTQCAMEALDLARCRGRGGSGEAMGDAVLTADLVEEDLARGQAEAVGEDLPVVGEDLFGNAVVLEGLDEQSAHGAPGRSLHDARADAEPGVVVDPGQHLALGAVF